MGLFSGLGKIVKGGIGLLPGGNVLNAALDYGVPLVAGLAGSKKQGQADQLRAQTLQRQQQDYARRAPLRDKALTLALKGPGAVPNLGGLYGAGKNPYSALSSIARPPAEPMR